MPDKENDPPGSEAPQSTIGLSPPWTDKANIIVVDGEIYGSGVNLAARGSDDLNTVFVRERTRLHETYIRAEALNKRIGLALASTLILAAALVLLFAPDGRETLSYWIGAALVIFAAGAVGFGRVWGKAAVISFGADQDKRGLKE